FRLAQSYGGGHTLGRFRISLGQETSTDPRPEVVQRREALQAAFASWLKQREAGAAHWQALRPAKAVSNSPMLTVLADNSVLSTGDISKRDVYDLTFQSDLRGVTALRLEVLPDDS